MLHSKTALGMAMTVLVAAFACWISLVDPGMAAGQKVAQQQGPPAVDLFGDPLPRGASARMGTMRFRSDTDCLCGAISPDGKIAVTAPVESLLIFWDVATGKELRRAKIPAGVIYCLTFSPDGKLLASCGDHIIRFWDPARGKLLWALPRSDHYIPQVAFSADGKLLAAVNPRKQKPNPLQNGPVPPAAGDAITLWDLATGKELHRLLGHQQAWALTFSPDNKLLASCHPEGWVLWDVATGKKIRHSAVVQPMYHAAFSPDGKTLATASYDGIVRLWDIATGQEWIGFPDDSGSGTVGSVTFSPDGKTLLAGGYRTIRLWDLATRKEKWRLERDQHYRFFLAVSGNFETLLLGGRTAVCTCAVGPAREPELNPEDRQRLRDLVARLGSNKFQVRQLATTHLLQSGSASLPFLRAALHGTPLEVKYRAEQLIEQIRATIGPRPQLFPCHQDPVHKVAFSADGKTLTTFGAWDCRKWDVATGKHLHCTEGKQDLTGSGDAYITSADGKFEAIWDRNDRKRIQLRKAGVRQVLHDWVPHQGVLTTAAFSLDGKLLATAGTNQEIALWNVATGKFVGRFQGPQGWITWLTFSPDGRQLASASVDTTILIWDVAALDAAPPAENRSVLALPLAA